MPPFFFITIVGFFSFILLIAQPFAFNTFVLIFFLTIAFIFSSFRLHIILGIIISSAIQYTQPISFFFLLPPEAFEIFDLLFSISLF